jgi:proline racemase
MVLFFTAVNLPLEFVLLLVTVDWFLDRRRTAVNVLGGLTVSCLLDGERPLRCLAPDRALFAWSAVLHHLYDRPYGLPDFCEGNPDQPRLRDIYGTIFFAEEGGRDSPLRQRNVTVFADGEVDRSPCGSGTSARLALLDDSGKLVRGDTLSHESIIGTEFGGRVVGETRVGEFDAVITEVEGSAYLTGYHQFVLRRDDPLGTGFLLR